jgi:hypothetical protein
VTDGPIVIDHPGLYSYQATILPLYYGPVLGGHRLRIIDEEGDIVLCYLNRMDPPELRLAKMRDLLCEHGFVRPGEDDPLGPLG